MDDRIRRIVILGGGTAGWLTACFLNRTLRAAPDQAVEITLVESPDIGIIGVGEATLAHLKRMMVAADIDEIEFMRCCDATFKNAIRFTGFRRAEETWWHPFTQVTHVNRYAIADLWLEASRQGFQVPYAEAVAPDPMLCSNHRAPKSDRNPPYQGLLNYAYHIDTIKLGRHLREVAVSRGVRRVVDTVVDVKRTQAGDVAGLITKENGSLDGDFFIDCSGFRGVLINRTLDEPFISFNDVLFNDRAVAMRVPYGEDDAQVRPFTGCHAQSAGWIWDIPLYRRRGIGHVYASAFMEPEQAERRLRDYAGPAAEGIEANHIPMRIGRTRNPWSHNVCAIGLSGGFIEPLESTGIYLAELGLSLLRDHFPTRTTMATMARQYNRHMTTLYEQIRDFICMHYCLTERTDSAYWRECRNHPALPDTLKEKLELWSSRLPIESDLEYSTEIPAFSAVSYCYVAIGMGHYPKNGLAAAGLYDQGFAEAVFRDRARITREAMATAPDHLQLLDRIHGEEGRTWAQTGRGPWSDAAGAPRFAV